MRTTAPPDPEQAPARPGYLRRLRASRPLRPLAAWRTALREFLVIVAGVLVALAAQAWWEGRQEREREAAYLAQLLSETRENRERFAQAVAEDSAAAIGIGRALAAVDGAGPAPPADSLLAWIGAAGTAADLRPLTGTYRALLGTGDLRLVRNDSLRALIVEHAAALENESARMQQLRGVVLDNIASFGRAVPAIRRAFIGGPRPEEVDVEAMRRDPEVATVLFTLQAANFNRLSALRRVRGEAERMLRVLRAEPLLAAPDEPPADADTAR